MSDGIDLRQGDCLKVMENIQPQSIDMILCDLPYGTTNIAWDKPIPFVPLWKQYERVIKDNGAIVLFSAQPFTTDLIVSNRKLFRYEIIWRKTQPLGFLNAKKMPLRAHENILVFYKKLPTYNPQKTRLTHNEIKTRSVNIGRIRVNGTGSQQYQEYRKPTWSYTETGERYPVDVIDFSNWNGGLFGNTKNATKHPTQKPVELCKYLVSTFSNQGDTVMDNCMGVGTTGLACIETQRNFIGIEINPKYYHIAEERIKQSQTQLRLELKEGVMTKAEMEKVVCSIMSQNALEEIAMLRELIYHFPRHEQTIKDYYQSTEKIPFPEEE